MLLDNELINKSQGNNTGYQFQTVISYLMDLGDSLGEKRDIQELLLL